VFVFLAREGAAGVCVCVWCLAREGEAQGQAVRQKSKKNRARGMRGSECHRQVH
jgi:hypothetical protein